jgi:hypothetical protein
MMDPVIVGKVVIIYADIVVCSFSYRVIKRSLCT